MKTREALQALESLMSCFYYDEATDSVLGEEDLAHELETIISLLRAPNTEENNTKES